MMGLILKNGCEKSWKSDKQEKKVPGNSLHILDLFTFGSESKQRQLIIRQEILRQSECRTYNLI